ncbi:MAG: SDR family oxidoreductase [bacterium]|nr:SDR family oxidoreductase [bacterium]
MKVELQGKVALVTGSAHRVGKAIAVEFARAGANIMVHYSSTSDDTARETLREIKSLGVDAALCKADLSQPDGIQTLMDAVQEHFGRLDVLVNSASNFQKRTIMEVTLAEWEETLRINLTAPFLLTQAGVNMMLANDPPGGVIINILDKGATDAWVEYAHHGVSKAGLYALTRVTAAGLGPHIRCNGIIPGAVLKPADYDTENWTNLARQNTPLQRPGTAEDVARAAVYLAGEDWLTGVVIRVDGGEDVL